VFLLLIWPIGKRWIRFIFAILALASLLAAEWMSQHHPQGAFYLLPTRGWELLIGASVALYFIGAKPSILAARETASLTNDIAATLGLLLIAYAVVAFDRNVPFPSFYALVPTVGAALVILFANQRSLVGKILSTRILVSVGLISYSAYLWHQPLFAFARIRNQGVLSTPLVSILCLAAVACAYFSWKFVEKPFRNRALIGRTTVFLSAAAMSLLFVLIGFVGLTTNGLAYRYSEDDRYLAAFDSFQAGRYVEKLFDGLELKPFDASGRRKIVVVGDSFAQDLVNAMNEGGLMTQLQVSTHWIPTQCGNLFLEANPISHVDQARRGICSNTGWYDSQALRKIMTEADAIWIASKWTPWEAELLPASIRNLTSTFHAPVLIFGPKNFGRFTIPELLHLSIAQRLAYKSAMVDSHIQLNDLMKSTLPANNFLDVSKLLCGPSNTCPLFTSDAKLISFDGGHLTKDGAAYFGRRLAPVLSAQGLIPAQ
jgi:SGNH domain (fused to AT3 domains)